ncbi:ABC transporter permease [Salipiger sp. IMCC34102]|uniref:ABC transporter permease n=1 Tax=Salipiger sp. IMCC34102 TaxID=2510647 RepID=UPI00101C5290|nr:ABC transporter permease [Salipiger sp. IMCC34102]RYH02425.1 ABC transporter permease [Salipiger sp. IMCC34102]
MRKDPTQGVTGWTLTLVLFVAVIGGWELIVRLLDVPSFLFPTPSAIAVGLWRGLGSGIYLRHTWVTLVEVIAGFALGSAIGFALGVLVALNRTVAYFLRPYILAFQTIPKVALVPVIVLWFGLGLNSKIVAAAIICFFPVMINTIAGLAAADPDRIALLRAMGASKMQVFRLLRLPTAGPYIFAGLEIAVTFALIGAIVAEFLGAEAGLGMLMQSMNFNMDVAGSFSILVLLSLIGMGLTWAIVLIRRRVLYWEDPADRN